MEQDLIFYHLYGLNRSALQNDILSTHMVPMTESLFTSKIVVAYSNLVRFLLWKFHGKAADYMEIWLHES